MTKNNINLTVSQEEALIAKAQTDLVLFGKLFLGGDFLKSDTPFFHKEMAKELMSESTKPCAFILARESAKTVLTKAKIIHDFCYAKMAHEWGLADAAENLFYGWCADSQKKSIRNVDYVRMHLKYNKILQHYFNGGRTLIGDKDNQEEITSCWGDRLMSSSNLTSMRGDTLSTIDEGAIRYSSVFLDDAESEKNTITENARERIIDNIMNGIMPAIDKNRPGRTLFFSGTPVHYASFTQKILDQWTKAVKDEGGGDPTLFTRSPDEILARKKAAEKFPWRVITYRSTQPECEGGVLWHSYRPQKILDGIKAGYEIRDGNLSGYYQEYELQVVNEDDALISRKYIRFYEGYYEHEDGINYLVRDGERLKINTFIGCDPATDIKTKGSSYSVIIAIGVDVNNNIYVLHYERHRSIPNIGYRDVYGKVEKKGVVDYILEMSDKYHTKHAVVENVAVTRSVFTALNEERRRLNKFKTIVIPENPAGDGSKLDRIYSSLSGRFAAGTIHMKQTHYDLITEISTFGPKMAHDDVMDALELACLRAYPPKSGEHTLETEIDRYTGGHKLANVRRRARDWQT